MSKNWYEDIFDFSLRKIPEICNYIPPSLKQDPTPIEINFARDILGIKPNSIILDLCCGVGRHSILLAKKGCKVVGLDLSKEAIKRATENAQKEKVDIKFIREDMRKIPFKNYFDVVINMSDSFGYLGDRGDYKCIESIANSLKPDGKFFLDILNREYFIAHPFVVFTEFQNYYSIINTKININTGYEEGKVIYLRKDGKEKKEFEISIRRYTLPEYKKMFEKVALKIVDIFGDFNKSKFTHHSPSMIIVARKEVKNVGKRK